ncbi:hypothetical protein J3A83DRAFT_4374690 [Scleroderma citrinum]
MAGERIEHSANDLPDDLPLLDDIAKTCTDAGFSNNGICIKVKGNPRFWTKYGGTVTLCEGLTQAHVANIVNTDLESVVRIPEVYVIFSRVGCRFIVMEHRLVNIKLPADTVPGPIGGGCTPHDFFLDFVSTLKYHTVEALEKHINAVVKFASPQTPPVDFRTETAEGLVLCFSDLDETNFMVDATGKLWSIDFGRTCFLPLSFVYYSLKRAPSHFGRCVAYLVEYPESANFSAMEIAAGQLVITGNNSLCAAVTRPAAQTL